MIKILNSYKSKWMIDDHGNYTRIQKKKYLFEFLSILLSPFSFLPKVNTVRNILGKKKQGVDFYENYTIMIENFIKNNDRQGYESEFQDVMNHLKIFNQKELKNKKIIDVSGEPGFFSFDLSKNNKVVLTSFNDKVTKTSAKHYESVNCLTYDFNSGKKLSDLTKSFGKFDFVFLRYCIGFCLRMDLLFKDLNKITQKNSFIYITYSRPSRAIAARWMFDDYVYLKLCSIEYLIKEAKKQNLELICNKEFSKFKWNMGHNILYSLISKLYTKKIFSGVDKSEKYQYNNLLVFKKK